HGDLFQLLYRAIMGKKGGTTNGNMQPFLQIGKHHFALEELISNPDDLSGWTGFITCEDIVKRARAYRLARSQCLNIEFASITTFNRYRNPTYLYGKHHARLPLPS